MSVAATTPTRAAASPRSKSGRRPRTHGVAGFFFVLPFLLIFVAMLLVPLGYAAYTSLYVTRLIGGRSFVGLANYRAVFADPAFLAGISRVARFLVLQVPIMLILSLLSALALDSGRLRYSKFIRLSVFIPYAVPSVVAALMWGYLYGNDFGPFAAIAKSVGVGAPQFLSPRWALASTANIVSWEFIGYNMIILYAALRAAPTELYEAASVDGAGAWRTAWSIKVPAIRPAIVLTIIFSIIGSFQLFNEPRVLRDIAPNAISSSWTPNLYAYNLAFTNQEVEYAAALSFVLGAVVLVISYTTLYFVRRRGGRS